VPRALARALAALNDLGRPTLLHLRPPLSRRLHFEASSLGVAIALIVRESIAVISFLEWAREDEPQLEGSALREI